MSDTMTIFDRHLVRMRRDRAAPRLDDHDFLFAEVAERLTDRLDDIVRRFPLALDLGCHGGEVARALQGGTGGTVTGGWRGGVETLLQCDLSPAMARRASAHGPTFCADEEWLPVKPGCLDAVFSNLSLHWVNDLPGALVQVRRALKPDGLFLGTLFGGETLTELRNCLAEAEIAVEGGLSPRTSPLADVRDAGNLLNRAGFALPTIDTDMLTVRYREPMRLLADLRGMGETNAVLERRKTPMRREILMRAMALYVDRFADSDGTIPATFQVIHMTAWAPHESQPQPARPGSATVSLATALRARPDDAPPHDA